MTESCAPVQSLRPAAMVLARRTSRSLRWTRQPRATAGRSGNHSERNLSSLRSSLEPAASMSALRALRSEDRRKTLGARLMEDGEGI